MIALLEGFIFNPPHVQYDWILLYCCRKFEAVGVEITRSSANDLPSWVLLLVSVAGWGRFVQEGV